MADLGFHHMKRGGALAERHAAHAGGGRVNDGDGYARGGRTGGKWIAGAIKHPGALHRALKVPMGEKIPAKKLAKAAHSSNPTLARRASLAKTLKGLHHGG